MASLGSDVQSTSIELVSIIEEMRERKKGLDAEIARDEEEKKKIILDMKALEQRLNDVNESLRTKARTSNELNASINSTYAAFKEIVIASQDLLNSAKESSRLQGRSAYR